MTKRKLHICIIDLIAQSQNSDLYGWFMNANLASIMPRSIAVWCEEFGHEVTLICFMGHENLAEEVPQNVDIVFIGAFTRSAQMAYALSNLFQARGAKTVLGGPHARCYPDDARKYFDYVVGFTSKDIIKDILQDCSEHRPLGIYLSAGSQPTSLPSIRECWKFIEITHKKAPLIKIVPLIASMGCPYNCKFCIDAEVPYTSMDLDVIKDDLRFLLTKRMRPAVAWHDPNFGVRFNECMDAIEEAVPSGNIQFIAESSLSILTEHNLKRLKHNGFKAILPGIESWYEMGNKSKTGKKLGMEKVRQISDHVNMILNYVPYVQVNFVVGLDSDPSFFELTKKFIEMTPGAFPGYSLLSAFGSAVELNSEFLREGRIIAFPFHFLDNNKCINVRPKNCSWTEFYDRLVDLTRFSFSWKNIFRRHRTVKAFIPRWMNFLRTISGEGFGRIKLQQKIRRLLDTDIQVRRFFEKESTEIPKFYIDWIRRDLGTMWNWLPVGSIEHNYRDYIKNPSIKTTLKRSHKKQFLSEYQFNPTLETSV